MREQSQLIQSVLLVRSVLLGGRGQACFYARLRGHRTQVVKGGSVEVESAGEWWEATISKVRDDKVKVHYVGGTEDEDEWIQLKRFVMCFSSV